MTKVSFTSRKAERGVDIPALLFDLLSIKSPSGKEDPIVEIVLDRISKCKSPKLHKPVVDTYKNIYVSIPNSSGDVPDIMFTAHMDTVHKDTGRQTLHITTGPKEEDKDYIIAFDSGVATDVNGVSRYRHERCVLGADDKSGVYILLKMLAKGVPGHYCFFVQEETGGIGSEFWRKNNPDLVRAINKIISFDRMNNTDIINRQRGSSCTSTKFENELAELLEEYFVDNFKYEPKWKSTSGSFTDSASFMDRVSECTNLSIGYKFQHAPAEQQDLIFLEQMVRAACNIDWGKLSFYRDPFQKTVTHKNTYSTGTGKYIRKKPHTVAEYWNASMHGSSFLSGTESVSVQMGKDAIEATLLNAFIDGTEEDLISHIYNLARFHDEATDIMYEIEQHSWSLQNEIDVLPFITAKEKESVSAENSRIRTAVSPYVYGEDYLYHMELYGDMK